MAEKTGEERLAEVAQAMAENAYGAAYRALRIARTALGTTIALIVFDAVTIVTRLLNS